MKVATWNVNSLRVRLPQLLDWLEHQRPDIVGLQETKLSDQQFPRLELEAAGYHLLFSGQKAYNGVALLSRTPPGSEVITALPGQSNDCRFLAADFGGLRVVNLYVPNGRAPGTDAFDYKLIWLAELTRWLRDQLTRFPRLLVMGDFNVAPDERDVYDPRAWENGVLFSGPERAAFQRLLELGLIDLIRARNGDKRIYSWWDYRFHAFRADHGLRIDHLLASPTLAAECRGAVVDPTPRGWARPSDHAPVVAQFGS